MTVAVERADLERFRDLVAQRLGLAFEEGKLDYLAEVLRRRIEDSGSREAGFYLQRLGAPAHGRAEFRALAEQLTVGESYFFRNVDHFRVFTELVLPACARVDAQRSTLDARRRPTTLDSSLSEPSVERRASSVERRRLRILSAGCAAGEEPYTVAMLVREHLPELASGDVQILGIDVNPAAIERAKRAHYSAWSLRETPAEMRDRYFRPSGREFVVDPAIRAMVAFEERNLVEQDATLWLPGAFDVVFCRNVTMYFPPPLTQAVIARIARALVPGGLLFLGHAETLRGVSHDFHLRHTHETFYYERRAIIDDRRPTTDDRDRSDTVVGGRWSVVAQAPAQETPGPGTSWIEAIQGASERIAALAREGASGARSTLDKTLSSGVERRASSVERAPEAPRARWDLGLVVELLREERFGEALKLLRALPPEAGADPDVLQLHAILLTNGGELVEAEKVCRRLLELDELSAGAHYLMALCREHVGDGRAAVEHDQSAIYLDPGFAMARLHLGLMTKRAGDLATASRELGQALFLFAREDAARILLFGGGFSREALVALCRAELQACGGGDE